MDIDKYEDTLRMRSKRAQALHDFAGMLLWPAVFAPLAVLIGLLFWWGNARCRSTCAAFGELYTGIRGQYTCECREAPDAEHPQGDTRVRFMQRW